MWRSSFEVSPSLKMLSLLFIFAWASEAVRVAPPPDIQFSSGQDARNLAPAHNRPDPRFGITCLGARSDISWIVEADYYQPGSMQYHCAQPRFGSHHRGPAVPNLGGYCEGGDVAFEEFGSSNRRPLNLRYIRSLLECRSRCFCSRDRLDPSREITEQPKGVPVTRKTFSGPLPSEGRAISISMEKKGPAGWAKPELLTRVLINAPGYPPGSTGGTDVGILPANMIECGGPLPNFDLTGPWNVAEFANNQELCAVQLSGGNPAANAGGYCHRDGNLGKLVAFAEDTTPRWDWTWSSYGTFLTTASLRFHCWKNCLCVQRSKKANYNDPLIPMWDEILARMPADSLSITKGNRNPLGSSTDAKGNIKTSASGTNQPAAQCVANATNPGTCTIPWLTDIMGPIPDRVAELAHPQPPAPNWDQNKQCGNKCESNSDCGSDCLCRIPSTQEAHSLGVDPVASAALCLSLASVFGRSLDHHKAPVECLCNATYTAPECCQSRDGMVQIR